jgi:uncharacterized protein with von Willebrand factor type A (vWA) domain
MNINDARAVAQRLRDLADKFSEGWHDGMEIDASDVMDLSNGGNTIDALCAEIEDLRDSCADKIARIDRLGETIERLTKVDVEPAQRTAGCTLCGYCAATGERIKGIHNLESLDD